MIDGVPPRGEQVPQGGQNPQGKQVTQGENVPIVDQQNKHLVIPLDMSNKELRGALVTLYQAMTTQANRQVLPRMNARESTTTFRLRDFGG